MLVSEPRNFFVRALRYEIRNITEGIAAIGSGTIRTFVTAAGRRGQPLRGTVAY
jgi:hypothetical protein